MKNSKTHKTAHSPYADCEWYPYMKNIVRPVLHPNWYCHLMDSYPCPELLKGSWTYITDYFLGLVSQFHGDGFSYQPGTLYHAIKNIKDEPSAVRAFLLFLKLDNPFGNHMLTSLKLGHELQTIFENQIKQKYGMD